VSPPAHLDLLAESYDQRQIVTSDTVSFQGVTSWASERKHLPDVDVAEMGEWSCVDTLKIYQRPDAETRQRVLTDRRPIREVS
jgi:hypothetical protein